SNEYSPFVAVSLVAALRGDRCLVPTTQQVRHRDDPDELLPITPMMIRSLPCVPYSPRFRHQFPPHIVERHVDLDCIPDAPCLEHQIALHGIERARLPVRACRALMELAQIQGTRVAVAHAAPGSNAGLEPVRSGHEPGW